MYPVSLSGLSLIEDFMRDVANTVLGPMMQKVLWAVYEFFRRTILDWYFKALYHLWVSLLKFVWLLEQIFDIFSGTTGIYVNGRLTGSSGNVMEDQNFLEVVFRSSQIQNAYSYIMLGAFSLCFLLTVFAVIRSMGDSIGEMKRPVGAVMRSALNAAITFLLVPMACLLIIKVGTVVTSIAVSFASPPDMRLCDALYVMTVGDNFKTAEARITFSSGRNFMRSDAISFVDYVDINYNVAVVAVLFMVIMLCGIILQAVMRVIALLTLFIISPYFVSMIPLDEGARFRKWARLFTGFAFATFGPMFVMRVYTVLVSMLGPGGSLSFEGSMNYSVTGWVLRLVIVLGGCFAAWKSQYVILEIISPETAGLLRKSNVIMAVAMQAGKAAAGYATGGASTALGAAGKGAAGAGGAKK